MNKFTILLSMLFITALSYGQTVIFEEDFDGGSLPVSWGNYHEGAGTHLWTFGSGIIPGAVGDFTTNAAIFDDNTAGDSGNHDEAWIFYPIDSGFDVSTYIADGTPLNLTYDYAMNVTDNDAQALHVGVWDNDNVEWIIIKSYTTDVDPTSDYIDLAAAITANVGVDDTNIYIGFGYDDLSASWGWGAGIDNVKLTTSPVNNNICDATPLTVGVIPAGDAYTTVNATIQTNEPAGSCWCCGDGLDNSVWFSFEATAADMTISTNIEGGTMTDTQFSVYAAPTDCADANTLGAEIGCGEDTDDDNFLSYLELTGLTMGDTYYIQVDGWSGEQGTFGISVVVTPPANNECDAAISLVVGEDFDENAIEATLAGATENSGNSYEEVWFTVTVPATGNLTIETKQLAGSPMSSTWLSVNSGVCGALSQIASDDDSGEDQFAMAVLTGQTPGEELTIRIEKDFDDASELGAFMISAYDITLPAPDNDACEDAIDISLELALEMTYTHYQDATTATNNGGFISAGCPTGGMNDGVWYAFENFYDGEITIDVTPDASWDPEIAVYTGSCGDFTCVASVDNGLDDGIPETLTFSVDAETIYFINIGYWSGSEDLPEGPFDIEVSFDCGGVAPANDAIANAISVTNGTFTDAGVNLPCATPDATEFGTECELSHIRTVFYKFKATASTTVTATQSNPTLNLGATIFYEAPSLEAIETDLIGIAQATNPCGPAGDTGGVYSIVTEVDHYYYVCAVNGSITDVMIDGVMGTTNITESIIDGFTMYPNPVQNTLNLTAQNTIDTVSIYNLLGQEVLNATPSTTQTQLDMSNLPTGAYIVKVQAGEQVGAYNLIKE